MTTATSCVCFYRNEDVHQFNNKAENPFNGQMF